MTTMQAARIDRFGGPEVIHLETLPVPRPQADEVLVRVAAAGIDPVDYKIRQGHLPMIGADQLPLTLGRELAGVVAAVGDGVIGWHEGDRVFAMSGDEGSYAHYARVPAVHLARVPDGLDLELAAAVPLAAHTAWQALFEHGQLEPEERVLIHGGSGGVGHFAIQLAKGRGATVCATGSAASQAFIRQLGADRAIDYERERFEDLGEFDLVIDLVGGETQRRSWAVLAPGGRLVSTLEEPDLTLPEAQGKVGRFFLVQPSGEQLAEIAALIERGQLAPHVGARFALQRAADAQRHLEEAHVEGKVVLVMDHAGR